MSQSLTGGFGERALERIIASDTFVPASVQGVQYSEEVEYVSGPVGSRIHHTGTLSVIQRWEDEDSRSVRIRGVCPSLYVKLYVKDVNESVLVQMKASDVIQFGEFTSLRGSFKKTVDEVDVKVDADSVVIDGVGSFSRATDVRQRNVKSYSSWNPNQRRGFRNYSYECGEDVTERLREAWAQENGVYSGVWRVDDVDDPDYSSTVNVTVVPSESINMAEELRFTLSMDEWDDNAALRALVEEDGNGLASNLEGETVFVSLAEYRRRESVAECGPWKLYRAKDKPNVVVRLFERYF